MTDITQESLQKKQEAIDLLTRRYRGMEQRTEDIDLRLRLYFEDLLEHSSAKEDDDNDWHGIYELLGAAKFLRMLDTYNFNTKKVQTVIRLREGEWVPVGKTIYLKDSSRQLLQQYLQPGAYEAFLTHTVDMDGKRIDL